MGRCIGVDEAGRGPVIGPLVVCSVCIPTDQQDLLEQIGVDDSKKVSKNERLRMFEEINSIADLRGWGIGTVICPAKEIDIYMKGSDLNSLEVFLFSKAIQRSSTDAASHKILLDACDVDEGRFGVRVRSELGPEWGDCEIISRHKMDETSPLVATASIIAKNIRDSEMQKLSEEIGFDLGSGYPSDPKTKIAIRRLCEGNTPAECLRWSWSTVKNTWSSLGKGELPIRGSDGHNFVQSSLNDWK